MLPRLHSLLGLVVILAIGFAFSRNRRAVRPRIILSGLALQFAFAAVILIGQKIALNEFIAYTSLRDMVAQKAISPRTITLATYALCGFANFGSLAIQIGGIGALAPSRRHDLGRLGLRALAAGAMASFMTATVAGMML